MADMFTLVIQEKNGPRRVESFDQNEVTIGRVQGNDIVLPKGNISKRHSRIVLRDGKFIIVDLKSTNGTYVNGKRINSPQVLKDSDKIYIGDYTLMLEQELNEAPATPPPTPIPEAPPQPDPEPVIDDDDDDLFGGTGQQLDDMIDVAEAEPPPAPEPPKPAVRAKEPSREPAPKPRPEKRPTPPPPEELHTDLPALQALQARAAVFSSVCKALSPDQGLPPDDDPTFAKAEGAAEKTLNAVSKKLQGTDTGDWAKQIAREVCGYGPLGPLLEDEEVTEIFVNGPHQILVRRDGALSVEPSFFSSEEAVALVVRRIMATVGQAFDAHEPIAEVRMSDGTRVNAVHHSAAVKGPLVTITRSSQREATLDELVADGVLSAGMAEFLETCVRARRNVVVCGGAGAGVGTVLRALAATIPHHERIVSVQQVARIQLPQQHVVTLEPRPVKGAPCAASMRDLVANALRMRPDRLVVHEVASGEAMELMIAMGGGQDGTLLSTYASSARDCLDRLETMMLMAGQELPTRVVREQIANSLDVIVLLTRFADGSYRVAEIAEVVGTEVDIITTHDIFTFRREGFDDAGGVIGRFTASGTPPRFYEDLQRRGESVNMAIFREG